MPEPRLDDPWLFRSNVTDSSDLSRFQFPRVSSSPDDLHIQFAVLGTTNILVALASGLLIASILRSPNLRRKPFDLYLVFIAIPDFVSGISCMFTCLLSVNGREYVSEAMCGYQSFYLNVTFAANTWMNAVLVYEIHKLLRYSQVRRRYIPPTIKQVILQATSVYAYACVWGVICAIQVFFPSHAYSGLFCIPMEEKGFSWFFYLIFLPAIFVLPSNYTFAVFGHIMWKGLLPPSGKRRQLAVFLLRIVFLSFTVWMPQALNLLIGNFFYFESDWGYFIPALMNHTQGILTPLLIFGTNEKIAASMFKVLRCDYHTDEPRQSSRFFSVQKSVQSFFSREFAVADTSQPQTPPSSGPSNNTNSSLNHVEDDDDDWLSLIEDEQEPAIPQKDDVTSLAVDKGCVEASENAEATRQENSMLRPTGENDETPHDEDDPIGGRMDIQNQEEPIQAV